MQKYWRHSLIKIPKKLYGLHININDNYDVSVSKGLPLIYLRENFYRANSVKNGIHHTKRSGKSIHFLASNTRHVSYKKYVTMRRQIYPG